jgi:DNA-binding Lrp family transcriptional regulator
MASVAAEKVDRVSGAPDFAFLTNYGKALLVIATDPRVRMRDIAALLQITERAAQRIVAELSKAGYINRERDGRRNRYSVKTHMPVGLPTQRDIDIESLLAILSR